VAVQAAAVAGQAAAVAGHTSSAIAVLSLDKAIALEGAATLEVDLALVAGPDEVAVLALEAGPA